LPDQITRNCPLCRAVWVADLSYVLGAAQDKAKLITDYKVIVTKSIVPVGTADKVKEIMKANNQVEFAVVSTLNFYVRAWPKIL
jgi:UDP-glucose 6-dehydrogenase